MKEMAKAQKVIARFYRRMQEKDRLRFFRKIGLFDATIYLEFNQLDGLHRDCSELNDSRAPDGQIVGKLESSPYDSINADSVIHIIGEFSPEKPWLVPVQCSYDPKLKCFKVNIMIR